MKQQKMFDNGIPDEPEYTHSWVARKPCGCIVATGVDCPQMQKTLEVEIGKWIMGGYKVERIPNEEVRITFWGRNCPHDSPEGDRANGS
jgi:hypothetical protein